MEHGSVAQSRASLLAASLVVATLGLVALASQRTQPSTSNTSVQARVEPVAVLPASTQASALRQGRPIDLNLATADDLRLLPGIGPKLAVRIVETRSRLGRFHNVSDLDAISGIGPKTLSRIQALVVIEANAHSGNSQPTDNVNAK